MIKVRHSQQTATIQNITFETDCGSEIEFKGQLYDGKFLHINLLKDEKIVGVYGYCWSSKQPEIVGLGFVIFSPNN